MFWRHFGPKAHSAAATGAAVDDDAKVPPYTWLCAIAHMRSHLVSEHPPFGAALFVERLGL
eukprot:6104627-Alexandrium_andersonii.AAC.1